MDTLVLKNTDEYEIEQVEADYDHPHPSFLGKIVNKTKDVLEFKLGETEEVLEVEPGQLTMLAGDWLAEEQWPYIVNGDYKVSKAGAKDE